MPKLVASRGYPLHYPENTAVGIEAAIAAGARLISVDIQLSRDGVPVLFQDRTLERVCGRPGTIHEHTADGLRDLYAMDFGRFGYKFSGTPIMRLAELVELLQHYSNVTSFIELRRVSVDRFGATTVATRALQVIEPAASQCVITSKSMEGLLALRRLGWQSIGAVFDQWMEREHPLLNKIDPGFLFCGIDSLPRWRRPRFRRCRLGVFETSDPEKATQTAKRGIEFVHTAAIGEMLAQANRRRSDRQV